MSKWANAKTTFLFFDPLSSIWLELNNKIVKNTLMAGFYRQWSNEDGSKEEAEENGMNIFSEQLDKAYKEEKNLIVMGDANLCSNKWLSSMFTHKKIANQLIGTGLVR